MLHVPFGPADGRYHGPATLTASPYVVSLRDCPGVSLRDRMAAEVRYCKALERRLGSPEAVADALRAALAIEAAKPADLSPEQRLAQARWQQANAAARLLGLNDLANVTGGRFDVRLWCDVPGVAVLPRRRRHFGRAGDAVAGVAIRGLADRPHLACHRAHERRASQLRPRASRGCRVACALLIGHAMSRADQTLNLLFAAIVATT